MHVMRNQRAGLKAPAAMLIIGTGLAAANFLGQGINAAIPTEIVAIISAVGFYLLGRSDSDMGAMISRRPDERQESIKTRARTVAATAMALVAVAGCWTEIALKGAYWQFQVVAVTGGASFLAALAFYTARDARQASGPDAGHQQRSPVSR
jgi:hypothetical protein